MTRYAKFAFGVILTGCLAACGGAPEEKAAEGETAVAAADAIMYFNTRLIAGDGSPAKPDTAFLVTGGKIVAMGAKADIKAPMQAMRCSGSLQNLVPTTS